MGFSVGCDGSCLQGLQDGAKDGFELFLGGAAVGVVDQVLLPLIDVAATPWALRVQALHFDQPCVMAFFRDSGS